MRVLFLGEIVGKAGIFCIKKELPKFREANNIDFVIANGDGTTGGFGMGKNHSIYLHKLGIDVLTTGECVYYKRDMVQHIQKASYILRAANYPPGNPGRGWKVYQSGDFKVGVINMMGQSGFNRVHLSNPFSYVPEIVKRIKEETNYIILDFHACTTAEKYTMFHHVDGLVSAVVGTHMKSLTADAQILSKGTAVLCDAGRTGSLQSVGGLSADIEIQKFLTHIPERSRDAWDGLEMQGAIIDLNEDGKAESIELIRHICKEKPDDRQSDGSQN